jgi:periplasmic protein TonB
VASAAVSAFDGASRLGAALQRRRARPSTGAVAFSVFLHGLVVLGMWLAGITLTDDLPEFEVYRVELVSPPPQVQGEPEPVVPTNPVIEEPTPEPEVTPIPQPDPPVQTQSAVRQEIPRTVEAQPAQGNNPEPVEVGGENANVRIEGQEFPYPEYLENIVLQLPRYLRWGGAGNLEATVIFYIGRAGDVGGLRLDRGSGNFNFDLEAMSAVEQAGRRGAFGELPDGFQGDRLWVRFTFLPPG